MFPSGECSEVKMILSFIPKPPKRFTDLTIIIRMNGERDSVQLEIIPLLVMQRHLKHTAF